MDNMGKGHQSVAQKDSQTPAETQEIKTNETRHPMAATGDSDIDA
jgi:hypothetical protein